MLYGFIEADYLERRTSSGASRLGLGERVPRLPGFTALSAVRRRAPRLAERVLAQPEAEAARLLSALELGLNDRRGQRTTTNNESLAVVDSERALC